MNKALGIALLIVGVVLITLGITAANSVGSSVSRVFTGGPTNKTILLLVGGIVSGILGLFLTLARSSKT